MAGMFYSLKEAAKKLGKTEDQVRQLVKENKLREFRDGSNLLFKMEEVNALLAEGLDSGDEALDLQELTAEPAEALGDTTATGDSLEEDLFKLDEEASPALEATGEGGQDVDLDILAGLGLEEEAAGTEPKEEEAPDIKLEEEPQAETAPEEASGIELEEPQAADSTAGEEDLLLAQELSQPVGEETPLADEAEGSSEEIALAPESGILAAGSDITDADTALTGDGINVLGETDTDYNVTEDSMAETAGPAASAGTSGEASLEEIEDDVNLDSFGSGSGLLDLSLQADDTSLGGILDEIYTSEGGEGDATPAEGELAEAGAGGEAASFDEITAEAEHAPAEEEMAVPEAAAVMPVAMAPAFAEAAPDAQSNYFGMLLFLPLVASLYTVIVAVSGLKGFMPGILSPIKTMIWPVAIAGMVVAVLFALVVSFAVGREKAPKAAKAAVKEKAKKPGKAAKAEKPAKEKKGFGLFGKKKEKGATGKGAAGAA